MYQLSDLALKAILEEWYPQEYDPPYTDVLGWARSIESLCDTYGIPDVQRAQCAAGFIKGELRTELLKALADSRAKFGPVNWGQFMSFIVAFDRERDLIPIEPPRLTQILQGISGSSGRVRSSPCHALVYFHTTSSQQNSGSTKSIPDT